jgi:hypothetical protein
MYLYTPVAQGFLCPQWAIDVTRYDPLRQLNEPFEFQLAELLPLAPSAQRDVTLLTSYAPDTRTFTTAVVSYPGSGLDSFWSMAISDDVSSATPVFTNVIVPHPDTAPGQPGSMVSPPPSPWLSAALKSHLVAPLSRFHVPVLHRSSCGCSKPAPTVWCACSATAR